MGRIGGLAVALGVGVAIVSGWSGGLAWADDSPGSAGTSASDDSAAHDAASSKPDDSPGETDSSPAASATIGTDAADQTDAEEPTTEPADASDTSAASAADADDDPPSARSTPKRSDRKTAEPSKKKTPTLRAAHGTVATDAADDHDAAPAERETDAVSRARRRGCRSYGAVGRQRVAADGDDSVTDGHRAARSQTCSVTYGWRREPGGVGRRQRDLEAAGRYQLAGNPGRRAVVVGDAGLRAARVRVRSAVAVRDGRTRHDE